MRLVSSSRFFCPPPTLYVCVPLQGWGSQYGWFRARALCALCINVCGGARVAGPNGYDALAVPCKQEVTVPPDARRTARHAGGPREALTAPRCTSSADLGERAVEQSRLLAVKGDALHHWCSGSSTVPPSSAAGALGVPRLPARLRGRPCPEGAPGGTSEVTVPDCVGVRRCHIYLGNRLNELSPATPVPTSAGQSCDRQVVHPFHVISTGPTL